MDALPTDDLQNESDPKDLDALPTDVSQNKSDPKDTGTLSTDEPQHKSDPKDTDDQIEQVSNKGDEENVVHNQSV